MKREPTYRQPVQFSFDIECDQSCGPRWSRHCGALGCARWTGDPSIAVAPSMAPAMAYVGGDTDVMGGCLRSAFLTPFRRRVNACSKLSTRVDFAVFNALQVGRLQMENQQLRMENDSLRAQACGRGAGITLTLRSVIQLQKAVCH